MKVLRPQEYETTTPAAECPTCHTICEYHKVRCSHLIVCGTKTTYSWVFNEEVELEEAKKE